MSLSTEFRTKSIEMWVCVETQSCSFKKSVFKINRDLEKAGRRYEVNYCGKPTSYKPCGMATALQCFYGLGWMQSRNCCSQSGTPEVSPTVEVADPTLLRSTVRDVLPELHHHHSSLVLKPDAKAIFKKTYLVCPSIITRNKLSTLTLQDMTWDH